MPANEVPTTSVAVTPALIQTYTGSFANPSPSPKNSGVARGSQPPRAPAAKRHETGSGTARTGAT